MPYIPTRMPSISSVEDLRKFVESELDHISRTLEDNEFIVFQVRHVAPDRPTAGMVAFADGTDWNPGSGRGLYEYRTSSWVKL